MGCGINGSGKLIGPDLGGSVIVIWFISNPLISLILLVRMTCSIPNRPFSFKSTYFSKKYPAITPQSAFASEGACANSTTTYQGTMYPLTVRYSQIHFQTLIHSVNTKCDSVKKPIMHRLWHRKENQLCIACGNAASLVAMQIFDQFWTKMIMQNSLVSEGVWIYPALYPVYILLDVLDKFSCCLNL